MSELEYTCIFKLHPQIIFFTLILYLYNFVRSDDTNMTCINDCCITVYLLIKCLQVDDMTYHCLQLWSWKLSAYINNYLIKSCTEISANNLQRIHTFKTWWKNPKNRKLNLCSLFGLNVFFSVLTLIWINYQCSKFNTYLVTIFLSEWGYSVYIEIALRLSSAPLFRAFKNMSAVMYVTFCMHICEYRMTWSISPLNIKL